MILMQNETHHKKRLSPVPDMQKADAASAVWWISANFTQKTHSDSATVTPLAEIREWCGCLRLTVGQAWKERELGLISTAKQFVWFL